MIKVLLKLSKHMTHDEFNIWFEKFLKRNGGWHPKNMDGWLKKIDEKHVRIRNLLGGSIRSFNFKINSVQNPLPDEIKSEFVSKLKKINNDIFTKLDISPDHLDYPLVANGTHNVIKTPKFLGTKIAFAYDNGAIDAQQRANINMILADLNNEWPKCKTSSMDIKVTISTTPRGFALLGHYGPDEDSCFRQNSSARYDKYVLAQNLDTFVITMSPLNMSRPKNTMRAVGFLSQSGHVLNITNCYLAPRFQEGNAIEAIKLLCKEILNFKNPIKLDNYATYDGGTGKIKFFLNEYGRWSFIDKDYKFESSEAVLTVDIDGLEEVACPLCGRKYGSAAGFQRCDDYNLCPRCIEAAVFCIATQRYTRQDTYAVVMPDKTQARFRVRYRDNYRICTRCQNFTYQNFSDTDGNIYCACCIEGVDKTKKDAEKNKPAPMPRTRTGSLSPVKELRRMVRSLDEPAQPVVVEPSMNQATRICPECDTAFFENQMVYLDDELMCVSCRDAILDENQDYEHFDDVDENEDEDENVDEDE